MDQKSIGKSTFRSRKFQAEEMQEKAFNIKMQREAFTDKCDVA